MLHARSGLLLNSTSARSKSASMSSAEAVRILPMLLACGVAAWRDWPRRRRRGRRSCGSPRPRRRSSYHRRGAEVRSRPLPDHGIRYMVWMAFVSSAPRPRTCRMDNQRTVSLTARGRNADKGSFRRHQRLQGRRHHRQPLRGRRRARWRHRRRRRGDGRRDQRPHRGGRYSRQAG